jgi:hypothetical protein
MRANSIQIDPSSYTATESSLNILTPTLGQPSPIHVKKISRILYEIGSILSFVGIGKDYKQNQNPNTNAPNSSLNSTQTSPSVESHSSRRSPNKKQTPSSNSSGTTFNASSNLLTPSSSLVPTMLSPSKSNSQSHSLTRLQRAYPYRFKSLSSHSSNTIDDNNNTNVNNNELKVDANKMDTINVMARNNSLSPNNFNNTSKKLKIFGGLNFTRGVFIKRLLNIKLYTVNLIHREFFGFS